MVYWNYMTNTYWDGNKESTYSLEQQIEILKAQVCQLKAENEMLQQKIIEVQIISQ